MKSSILFFQSLFMLVLGSCLSGSDHPVQGELPFYNSPAFNPVWIDEGSSAYTEIHTIAPFSFVNQNGDSIHQEDLLGKIYVADFFFTFCPGICPKLTQNMGLLQERYREVDEVMFLSHTVTPWVDSVDVLKRYADFHKVDAKKWHLLTGEKTALYSLARTSYFADEDIGFQRDEDDFLHTENFILIDQKGRIRGVYNGTLEVEMKRLSEDIERLRIHDN